ncbi:UNVERIFIED_CONTAM: hypothetical protein HDU68_001039 [Siphonaria sp. JEL0065]|nr:hypothetical protein HDU68_001039 [Siphonaria sp. JEL0065]
MQNVNTKSIGFYLIRVKDSAKRDEVLSIITSIKELLAAASYNGVADNLILGNIPNFVQYCHYLTPSNVIVIDCNVVINIRSIKTQQLGLCKMALKTLESPMGRFKVVSVVSESDSQRVILESLITSDILIQDCRTTNCALIKLLFASKARVEYQFEFIVNAKAVDGSMRTAPIDSAASQVVISYFTKDILPYEKAFPAPKLQPSTRSGLIRSASYMDERSSHCSTPPKVIGRAFKSSRNLSTGLSGKKNELNGNGSKVGGWVASQVRFFNGLAQRTSGFPSSTTPISREKADNRSAFTGMAKGGNTCDPIDDELQKWIKYFSHEVSKDTGLFVFPPQSCPEEILAAWIFIPFPAKVIIASTEVFDKKFIPSPKKHPPASALMKAVRDAMFIINGEDRIKIEAVLKEHRMTFD